MASAEENSTQTIEEVKKVQSSEIQTNVLELEIKPDMKERNDFEMQADLGDQRPQLQNFCSDVKDVEIQVEIPVESQDFTMQVELDMPEYQIQIELHQNSEFDGV